MAHTDGNAGDVAHSRLIQPFKGRPALEQIGGVIATIVESERIVAEGTAVSIALVDGLSDPVCEIGLRILGISFIGWIPSNIFAGRFVQLPVSLSGVFVRSIPILKAFWVSR